MNEYLIFHYAIDGVEMVDAYRTNGAGIEDQLHGWLQYCVNGSPLIQHHFAWVSAPSRNQARWAAFTNWIGGTRKDFNARPYRVYAL